MFGKKDIEPTIRHMELFHEENLYLPTRTIYFGGNYYKGTNFITPKNSSYLKFMYIGPPKREKSPDPQGKAGSGDYIYAKYVEGQEPKKYLGRAILSEQSRMKMLIGSYIMNDIKNVKGI